MKDDGRGIPVEEPQRRFDSFTRGENSRAPGSGIGLAYCAQAVRHHGGRLWVESTPGQGAVFYVTVNLAEAAVPQPGS